MMNTPTQDEILKAIQEAVATAKDQGNEPGTVTRSEVQAVLGIGEEAARRKCRMLVDQGVLAPVRPIWRRDMWGIMRPTVGYRYIQGENEE